VGGVTGRATRSHITSDITVRKPEDVYRPASTTTTPFDQGVLDVAAPCNPNLTVSCWFSSPITGRKHDQQSTNTSATRRTFMSVRSKPRKASQDDLITTNNVDVRQLIEHRKSVHVRYLTGIPRKPIPQGQCVVHNHVRPAGFPNVPVRTMGFRVWRQDLEPDRLEICDCGWAPELERHYRVKQGLLFPSFQVRIEGSA
jgi:hypothetical protein